MCPHRVSKHFVSGVSNLIREGLEWMQAFVLKPSIKLPDLWEMHPEILYSKVREEINIVKYSNDELEMRADVFIGF